MNAWDLATIETERVTGGQPYREFLRVPDLSAGLYVLEAGCHGPAVAAQRGRALLRRLGSQRCHGGCRDARRPARVAGLRLGFGPASVPYHHRAASDPGRLRAGGGCSALIGRQLNSSATASASARASSGPRPTSSWRKKTKASSPAARNGSRRAAQAASSAVLIASVGAGGRGTDPSVGSWVGRRPRAARSCRARRRLPPAHRRSRRRATTHPGTPW